MVCAMPVLNWPTREADCRVAERIPYRLLQTARGAQGAGAGESGNLLIQGDNLDALKSLLPYYAGQVKCIFIDPPYNTRSKISEHYDDNLEHSQWLAMMHPRLLLLRALLAEDGSIWAIIDDDEGHYLRVLMDEVFGRKNFVANVVWQKKHTRANDARWFSDNHDHIVVHAKNKGSWKINLLPREERQNRGFSNPDNDPRGPWASQPIQVKTPSESYIYEISNPVGKKFWPPRGRSWQFSKERFNELVKDNRIWFGKDGSNVPRIKSFLSDVQDGITPVTIWPHEEVGHNQDAKKEVKAFNADNVFSTPKPEKLIQRVLQLATNEGDLVLDSFLGSGTTAAVAHKMGRRWIGIELGEHAVTHCAPRLKAVVEGEQGGISKAVNWQGGGSFEFCSLGEVAFTPDGKINPQIRFPVLAAHVWFTETHRILGGKAKKPFLGVHEGKGYALLYNGILSDRSVGGGNVLTQKTLASVRRASGGFDGPLVIYAAANRLGQKSMERERITFKQTPYEIKTH